MIYESKDKFDYLLDMGVSDCGSKDIDFFKSLDDSNVVLSDRLNKIIRRLISREENKTMRRKVRMIFTRLAVAMLIIMSLMFTLIACIPVLRDAVWDAILEWHEKYVTVDFGPVEDNGDTGEKEDQIPTYIQQYYEPTFYMENLEHEEIARNNAALAIEYFIGDDFYFLYTQGVLSNSIKIDNNMLDMKTVNVNGNTAVLIITENDLENKLIWSDGQYLFSIYGTLDEETIIKVAEIVK